MQGYRTGTPKEIVLALESINQELLEALKAVGRYLAAEGITLPAMETMAVSDAIAKAEGANLDPEVPLNVPLAIMGRLRK
jgi:hypothetical protein